MRKWLNEVDIVLLCGVVFTVALIVLTMAGAVKFSTNEPAPHGSIEIKCDYGLKHCEVLHP